MLKNGVAVPPSFTQFGVLPTWKHYILYKKQPTIAFPPAAVDIINLWDIHTEQVGKQGGSRS